MLTLYIIIALVSWVLMARAFYFSYRAIWTGPWEKYYRASDLRVALTLGALNAGIWPAGWLVLAIIFLTRWNGMFKYKPNDQSWVRTIKWA